MACFFTMSNVDSGQAEGENDRAAGEKVGNYNGSCIQATGVRPPVPVADLICDPITDSLKTQNHLEPHRLERRAKRTLEFTYLIIHKIP